MTHAICCCCPGPASGRFPMFISLRGVPSAPAGLAARARTRAARRREVWRMRRSPAGWGPRPTVICWRDRYAAGGGRRPGGPGPLGSPTGARRGGHVVATLEAPPERLGVTHWSARLLARELGSPSPRWPAWRKWKLPTVAGRDVQVLHRPRAGRECPRRRGPVPRSPGQGRRGRVRRNSPGPGVGPDMPTPPGVPGSGRLAASIHWLSGAARGRYGQTRVPAGLSGVDRDRRRCVTTVWRCARMAPWSPGATTSTGRPGCRRG